MAIISTVHTTAGGTFDTTGETYALPVSFDKPTTISRLGVFTAVSGTNTTVVPYIWDGNNAGPALLATGTSTTGVPGTLAQGTPLFANISYNFAANTVYYVGCYQSSQMPYENSTTPTQHAETAAGGVTMTVMTNTGQVAKWATGQNTTLGGGGSTSYEWTLQFDVVLNNVAPNAPTGLVVPTPVLQGGNPTASWTFSDPDAGNTQGKYQIRWRRKD